MDIKNYSYENGISIKDIFIVLFREKITIFITTIVSLVLAISYLFIKTPIYKTEVIISKPYNSQIMELDAEGVFKITAEDVFSSFKEALKINKYFYKFYGNNRKLFSGYSIDNENVEASLSNIITEWNLNNFIDTKKEVKSTSFSIEYPSYVQGYILLNNYIKFVIEKEKTLFIDELDKIRNAKIKKLNHKISANKKAYEVIKKAQMEKINEAIFIARAIGLKKSYKLQEEGEGINSNIKSATVIKAEISNQQTPLYYRGYEALEAEKQTLVNRSKDDLFIPGIIDLEKQIYYLKQLNPEKDKIAVANLVHKAFKPGEKIKPRGGIVLLVSVFVGFILGMIIIYLKSVI
ncbi:hypothetical protein H0A36_16465 [Endozoicomonas sp. SM1973]|uniref:Polysaccharide chain length determinant N-terminal domain-containing protein n=1 Tax=Spartinivicinus marinus TaxID=2994442 RepID=A0A853IDL6_9GAMM|nr:Wzz/FepE/Etk N-terminal domain-containing protein [Spartinivicinus marinus]MCX4028794.1 Wzz/FepE/Etk N-terminal domain-containing protein [Spartinivicinus marinus]NYZ67607.1 hypothetical protein [Spartinivicinus marinus]